MLAERGGGTDPETSLPDCSQIANRTCVLCCVRSIITSERGGKQWESALTLPPFNREG